MPAAGQRQAALIIAEGRGIAEDAAAIVTLEKDEKDPVALASGAISR